MVNINDFLGITVVGAALSGVIQWVKSKFEASSVQNKLVTIALAIVVGSLYVWLQGTPWFSTVLGVLAAASAVYALLLK